jgi:acyl-CoA dehydrogenase
VADTRYLKWPFFDDTHRAFAADLDAWARTHVAKIDDADAMAGARAAVTALGKGGWLKYTVIAPHGGLADTLDVRTLCIARETLARYSGLVEFSFAMQGLGSGPITLAGSDAQRAAYLPRVASGDSIAAFAISEAEAGSNVAATETAARKDGADYIINGEKTWISNAGVASFYVVLARTGEAPGTKGLSLFVIDADAKGADVTETFDVMAPHPLGTVRFTDCRVAASAMIGKAGDGFKITMATLDIFRSSVGAAALGFARRAMEEATAHARTRVIFDRPLAEFQMTQQRLAEMAVDVDTSALLVYRAAWTKDGGTRVTREAAMAKLHATEAAQRVIDNAVQLIGSAGVVSGHPVERLYRDIRPLRIYEGTTEIQKLIVAREVLKDKES